MGLVRYRSPSGETRYWTLKEMIRGKPINRPTHPMLVIFPIAFYTGALALDVLSRLGIPGLPLAATYAVFGSVIGAAAAILTGLVDRSTMRPGSRIRKMATRHMLIQFTATAIFIANLALRWSDRHLAEAKPLWLVLDVIGVITVIVGGDVGGQMVFRMGYRVGEGREEAASEAASSGADDA